MNRPLPPSPCLIAILLVARTGAGPRLVLHYPPNPSLASVNPPRTAHNESDESDKSDDEDDESLDDTLLNAAVRRGSDGLSSATEFEDYDGTGIGHKEYDVLSKSRRGSRPDKHVPVSGWKMLFGHSKEGIAKMLAPNTRTWHKKKLEVSLDDLSFVGCPIYCREEGGWDKKDLERRIHKLSIVPESQINEDQDDSVAAEDEQILSPTKSKEGGLGSPQHSSTTSLHSASSPVSVKHKHPISTTPRTGTNAVSRSLESQYSVSSSGSQSTSLLTMFNVVFLMCPLYSEHNYRVDQMYDNVIRSFARGLAEAQKKQNFVEKEVHRLDKRLAEAKETGSTYATAWSNLPQISPLARALQQVYLAISSSQVAHITLGHPGSSSVDTSSTDKPKTDYPSTTTISLSLQLPLSLTTPHVPTPQFPSLTPGLPVLSVPLTTTLLPYDTTLPNAISPHTSLLLTHPSPSHLSALLTSPPVSQTSTITPLTPALHFLIHHASPRKTLAQLSSTPPFRAASLGPNAFPDLQFLALTLITLRFARAIPPLNAGNTYILNPNADLRALPAAEIAYGRRFSSLVPGLQVVLSKLGKVKAEGKAGAGMGARPWAALIPSKDHKAVYMEVLAWLVRGGWAVRVGCVAWVRVPKIVREKVRDGKGMDAEMGEEEGDGVEGKAQGDQDGLTIPARKKRASSTASSDASSATTAVLAAPHPAEPTSPSEVDLDAVTSPASKRHNIKPTHLSSLVSDPSNPTSLERAQLEYMRTQLLPDEDLKEWWPKLLKYFDGRTVLEDLGVREEAWGRKNVGGVLRRLMELKVDKNAENDGQGEAEGEGEGLLWCLRVYG